MELNAPGLENALVRFEPMGEQHWLTINTSDIQEAFWRWMPAQRGGTSLRAYFDYILQAQKLGMAATFILFRQSDGAFAGITGMNEINKLHRRVRIAIAWHPPELGSPELYKAGQLAMFQRAYDWRAKRVEWQVNPNNTFFMEELAQIGPTEEARFRNFERTADGLWVDKVIYSMTRAEMVEAIARLERDIA